MSPATFNAVEQREPASRGWVSETVRRIQRGASCSRDLERLFCDYEPKIRSILRKTGWKEPDLDDLVQEVMLRTFRGLRTFRLDSSFDTWILRIVSNVEKNAIRAHRSSKARATRTSLEDLTAGNDETGPRMSEPKGHEAGPLESVLASERRARLAAALYELPARMRQCLLFRYYGYKYAEIAQAQGVSVATVKKQVNQGHKRLRPILGRFVEVFGIFIAMGIPL